MKLCSNRPEGFGPTSPLSSPIPSTCFVDTILIPLPTWLALALLPLLLALSIHHRKANFNPSTAHLRATSSRNCLFTTVSIIYYLLIAAQILMVTLEIVRLELIHFGIALLPFAYVGLLVAAYLHFSEGFAGRIRGWQGINVLLWLGGCVMTIVQIVGLDNVGDRVQGAGGKRRGSKYPLSDQIIDVAVMAGVYAVLAVLEVGLDVWRAQRRRGGVGRQKMGTPGSEERVVRDPNMEIWDAARKY